MTRVVEIEQRRTIKSNTVVINNHLELKETVVMPTEFSISAVDLTSIITFSPPPEFSPWMDTLPPNGIIFEQNVSCAPLECNGNSRIRRKKRPENPPGIRGSGRYSEQNRSKPPPKRKPTIQDIIEMLKKKMSTKP